MPVPGTATTGTGRTTQKRGPGKPALPSSPGKPRVRAIGLAAAESRIKKLSRQKNSSSSEAVVAGILANLKPKPSSSGAGKVSARGPDVAGMFSRLLPWLEPRTAATNFLRARFPKVSSDARRTTYMEVMIVCHFEIFERWTHDCNVSDDAVDVEVVLMLWTGGKNQLFHPRI